MSKDIYRLSAFAKTANGGNPAGVVLDADHLKEIDMKRTAAEVGYSETAFVMTSNKADFRVRFFTPLEEVDLCGHATIATFNLLRDLGKIQLGDYTQETKAGVLKLRIMEDKVYMEQTTPEYRETLDLKEVLGCFESQESNYFYEGFPLQIVSTGLPDLIVPVKNMRVLHGLKPKLEEISNLSKKYNIVGIHAFSLDTLYGATAHCRNFAPLYGIDEESATGTANGALAAYLSKYYKEGPISNYVFEQGYSMERPSEIKVQLTKEEDKIVEVYVGGNAIRINQ